MVTFYAVQGNLILKCYFFFNNNCSCVLAYAGALDFAVACQQCNDYTANTEMCDFRK